MQHRSANWVIALIMGCGTYLGASAAHAASARASATVTIILPEREPSRLRDVLTLDGFGSDRSESSVLSMDPTTHQGGGMERRTTYFRDGGQITVLHTQIPRL